MFSRRLPLKLLAQWCWSLGSSLRAGMSLLDALKVLKRRGRPRLSGICDHVRRRIEDGDDFVTALHSLDGVFPPLFLALADVACHTGRLPEALRSLEDYYRFQLRLRRQFLSQIFWPAFQLAAAILVVALLIYLLGIVADTRGGPAIDFLGFGLLGANGALAWLAGWAAFFVGLAAAYWVLRTGLGRMREVDSTLLRIPALGPCLHLLALSRLSLAMRMTLDSGMSVLKAIRLSLDATDNGAFIAVRQRIVDALEEGDSLHDAFSPHGIFPAEFLEVLYTGEQSGSVPEAMGRLSNEYSERAEHQLTILNTVLGWMVWCCVAAIIIFLVFRIFSTYVGILNQFLP
jgi:type II secretory pathway component PulF